MILLSVLSLICWVLASLCNAVMDTLADRAHFEQSIFSKYNSNFWLKTDSWAFVPVNDGNTLSIINCIISIHSLSFYIRLPSIKYFYVGNGVRCSMECPI